MARSRRFSLAAWRLAGRPTGLAGRVLAGLVVWLVAPAAADAAARKLVVVEVAPADDWRARALAAALTADLADDRLATRALPACGGPCSDGALAAAGAELVVRAGIGDTGEPALAYELRALWRGAAAPVRGTVSLRGLDREDFAGELRDQLHRLARSTADDAGLGREPASSPAQASSETGLPSPATVAAALAAVLLVLATPLGLGALTSGAAAGAASGAAAGAPGDPPRPPGSPDGPAHARRRRFVARAAARRTALGVLAVGAAAITVCIVEPANGRGVLLAAGGIAWAGFAAVTLPVLCPPLVGLGRADYRELWPMLAGWGGLVVRRAVLLALVYAPVAGAAVIAGGWLGPAASLGGAVWPALVLPLALLVVRQWCRLAVVVAAERLDEAIIEVAVAAADRADHAAWADAVRGYFVGYLRRSGLALDDDLLGRIAIVVARGGDILVYGGGATHTRIAIPRELLVFALAPWGRPHDASAPRLSTLHWTEWNTGLVMATEAGAPIASSDQRQPRQALATADDGDADSPRAHLGVPPTLAGLVEPAALDPRSRYRPHDAPAWLDWDVDDDYDGTDPDDKDFLFGALVHAVAQIQRHADRPATLALALAALGRASGWIRALRRRSGGLLDWLSDAAGDQHAAIQGARHHLIQYLGWQAWRRPDLLTARAYAPELEAMSRRLVGERGPVKGGAPAAARARDRLARLAGFVAGAPPVRARWRRVAVAAAVVACAGVAASAVTDAVRYRAGFVDPALGPAGAGGAGRPDPARPASQPGPASRPPASPPPARPESPTDKLENPDGKT